METHSLSWETLFLLRQSKPSTAGLLQGQDTQVSLQACWGPCLATLLLHALPRAWPQHGYIGSLALYIEWGGLGSRKPWQGWGPALAMTWLRGKYWIYFYELVITLRPLRGTVRSESIRRLRRSQLTCKNKSNIFHSVLLDLFDADIQEGSLLLLLLFFF